jgi:hypothetical protein
MTAPGARVRELRPPVPPVHAEFLERLADMLTDLGYDEEFCRQQPENRDQWSQVAVVLEVRQARARFRVIQGGAR